MTSNSKIALVTGGSRGLGKDMALQLAKKGLDVIITYLQHKYLAELKIWRGKTAHEEGLLQLCDYLDRLSLTEGYLLIFDHSKRKIWKKEWTEVQGKKIYMVWV